MISAIVAVDNNYGIGSKNKLLVHIPEDMKLFKDITSGGTVIIGRKTYESIPNRPLPNRTNIVITKKAKKRPKFKNNNTLFCNMNYIKSLLSDKEVIENNNGIYVIGGSLIYNELLKYCERVYLTKIFENYNNVDSYFPSIDNMKEWKLSSESEIKEYNNTKYAFCIYDRNDYEIISVNVKYDDLIIEVKTFNNYKTVVLTKDNKVCMCDWEYLKIENNLNKFIKNVELFKNKCDER